MSWHPPIPLHITDASGAKWLVRRAWPGPSAGDYILEVQSPRAPGVRAAHLRQGLFEAVPVNDPKLPSLEKEASKGIIVVHRAHTRAVVRSGDRYIKVFRSGRAPKFAARQHLATADFATGSFNTPPVLEAGKDVLVFSALPGRSYFDLGKDQVSVTDEFFARQWSLWAKAWADTVSLSTNSLLRGGLDGLPAHPVETEVETIGRWVNHWLRHSEGIPEAAPGRAALHTQAEAVIDRLRGTPPDPLVWAHGDLHDKQLLEPDGAGTPGLLDFDEACQAEAALDLANLDVHLQLRRCQNVLTPRRYAIAHGQILAVAGELRITPERFAVYAACTRLRLGCVYSFRPPWGARASHSLNQLPRWGGTDALNVEPLRTEGSLT
jgi:hypothetical protein